MCALNDVTQVWRLMVYIRRGNAEQSALGLGMRLTKINFRVNENLTNLKESYAFCCTLEYLYLVYMHELVVDIDSARLTRR